MYLLTQLSYGKVSWLASVWLNPAYEKTIAAGLLCKHEHSDINLVQQAYIESI